MSVAAGAGNATNSSPQRNLFAERPASNVIPFDVLTGGRATRVEPPAAKAPEADAPAVEAPAVQPPPTAKPITQTRPATQTKRARKTVEQPQLDFLPSSQAPRTLKTSVQAVIFCDAPVATLSHRSLAFAVDFSLVLVAYGMCLTSYSLMGGGFSGTRLSYLAFAGTFILLALFYGLLWMLARTETPGMRWTSLRLTNFDGFAPDPGQRALRYFATILSFACGFGLLWALVDEESLTWQDHISKTFPTFHRPE